MGLLLEDLLFNVFFHISVLVYYSVHLQLCFVLLITYGVTCRVRRTVDLVFYDIVSDM